MTAISEGFTLVHATHGSKCQRCEDATRQATSTARATGSRRATGQVWSRLNGPDSPLVRHSAIVARRATAADHDPIVEAHPGTRYQPAEVTVTCAAAGCDWTFESQESIGGPVGAWGDAWAEHEAEVS